MYFTQVYRLHAVIHTKQEVSRKGGAPSRGSLAAGAARAIAEMQMAPVDKGLWAQMPVHIRDRAIAKMRVCPFPAGEAIIQQNTIGTAMYFLDNGSAAADVDGSIVNTFAAGDFFGEVSFVATAASLLEGNGDSPEIRRTATVTASEPCRCLELGVKDLFDIFRDDADALKSLLRMLAQCADARIASAAEISNGKRLIAGREQIAKAARTLSSDCAARQVQAAVQSVQDGDRVLLAFMRDYVKGSAAVKLLEAMSERSRNLCMSRMVKSEWKKGEHIIRTGDVGTSLVLIQSGTALAVSHGNVVEELAEGSLCGEIAFVATCMQTINFSGSPEQLHSVTDQLRTCDVIAQNDVCCWELHVRDFVAIVGSDLPSNWAVMQMLTKTSTERVHRLVTSRLAEQGQQVMEGLRLQARGPTGIHGRASPEVEPMRHAEFATQSVLLIPGKLGFCLFETDAHTKKAIMEQRDVYFFSSDFHEDYVPFHQDFGPVNIGVVYQFCKLVTSKISDPRLGDRVCTYYAESDGPRRTNAAFLLGAYLIIMHGWTPEDANSAFESMGPGLLSGFHHALSVSSDFKLTILDCLRGLKRAMDSNWFSMETFDLDRYLLLENPGQFDLHQICPKFVAFRGPDSRGMDARFHPPELYCNLFKILGVTAVVRLNDDAAYSPAAFTDAGIRHYDLTFPDCSLPPRSILDRFLSLCDEEGLVAVHCLAGLGRTGTLIAFWMMKRHKWRARDAIGWLRLVRPGSVLGDQQEYLVLCEQALANGDDLMPEAVANIDVQRGEMLGQDLLQTILRRQETMTQQMGGGHLQPVAHDPHTSFSWKSVMKTAQNVVRAALDGHLTVRGNPLDSPASARSSVFVLASGAAKNAQTLQLNAKAVDKSLAERDGLGVDLLKSIPQKYRDACISKMREFTFQAGQIILEQGTIGTTMYFLDYGCVSAEIDGRVINTFTPGDLFGEVSFIALALNLAEKGQSGGTLRRTATVKATEMCRCLELGVKDLFEVFGADKAGLAETLRVLVQSIAKRIAPSEVLQPDVTPVASAPSPASVGAGASAEDDLEQQRIAFMRTYVSQPQSARSQGTAFHLLDLLADQTRMQCVSHMKPVRCYDGQVIVQKGTVGTALYMVGEGSVKVIISNLTDGEIVQELKVGALFGEIAFVAACSYMFQDAGLGTRLEAVGQQLRTCDVQAVGDSLVWELHVNDFVQVVSRDIASNWMAIEVLAKSSQRRMQRLTMMNALRESAEMRRADATPSAEQPDRHFQTTQVNRAVLNFPNEIIPGKLGFCLFETQAHTKKAIMEQRDVYFFSSDFHEDYVPFHQDFGPVNIGVVYQFCKLVTSKISDPRLGDRVCTYYAESDGPRRTNAAFLLGAYLIIMHGWTPEDSHQKFHELDPEMLLKFQHALSSPSHFQLSVLDCLRGLKRAMDSNWFSMETFDLDRYLLLENPGQFDLHQICPKFVAFRGPRSVRTESFRPPESFCDLFKSLGVTTVVRLNETETYDRCDFESRGIAVRDLPMDVGKCPSKADVDWLLNLSEGHKGVIAVHCAGGRGRTATMIAACIIREHGWGARDAIAWLRLVRPGSVLGKQQEFLASLCDHQDEEE